MLELIPCPFCGSADGKPVLDKEYAHGSGRWAAVVCCIVGPEIRADYGQNDYWQRDAIAEWNNRVLLPAPPVSE